jgi:PEP-CTERM motif
MKKIIVTILSVASVITAYSQGTVNFANAGGGLNAPIVMNDGTTKIATSGTWMIELMASATPTGTFSVIDSTTALAAPGYFNGGVATVAGISAGGAASFQVLVWDTSIGSTFNLAESAGVANAWGESSIFTLAATGNPTTTPAGIPAVLVGMVNGTPGTTLGGSNIILNPVPEPTTLALGALGGLVLMAFRRRKS